MRHIVLSLALLFAAAPAIAGPIADPVAYVKHGYQLLAADKDVPDDPATFTPRLRALFALEKKEAGGEVGRLDFDYWTNGQDWKISRLAIRAVPVEGAKDREIVFATFHNIDRDEEIHFYFEKGAGGWQLDDVRSLRGEEPWTLSLILKYGWDGKD
ncbi:MAG TPA: hypothetical protein VMH86_02690 [Rhizomicrobium sp.]|nr:hypothetical protein [Rhizomicrobium sp.]